MTEKTQDNKSQLLQKLVLLEARTFLIGKHYYVNLHQHAGNVVCIYYQYLKRFKKKKQKHDTTGTQIWFILRTQIYIYTRIIPLFQIFLRQLNKSATLNILHEFNKTHKKGFQQQGINS